MEWLHAVSYFFGGAFLANAVPHFVSGTMGGRSKARSPTPRGQGLSSSTVNVLWGFFNIVVFYGLVCRAGAFDLGATGDVVPLGLGILLMGLFLARQFGRFHGGNAPERS